LLTPYRHQSSLASDQVDLATTRSHAPEYPRLGYTTSFPDMAEATACQACDPPVQTKKESALLHLAAGC